MHDTHLQGVVTLPGELRLPHAVGVGADARIGRLVTHRKGVISRRRDHARQPPLAVVVLAVRDARRPSVGPVLRCGADMAVSWLFFILKCLRM